MFQNQLLQFGLILDGGRNPTSVDSRSDRAEVATVTGREGSIEELTYRSPVDVMLLMKGQHECVQLRIPLDEDGVGGFVDIDDDVFLGMCTGVVEMDGGTSDVDSIVLYGIEAGPGRIFS
ncbi:hypothetical protein BGX28_004554 [Mortierella sp. GBA30]|nr:hypothetical protein BGX28_004554 [Mortierella sp. GBA30]